MVNFQTKNHNFVNFGLSCNGRCWYILRIFGLFYVHLIFLLPFGIFRGNLGYFLRFGILHQEKSGNPDPKPRLSFVARRNFAQNLNENILLKFVGVVAKLHLFVTVLS
jgi:hypothetical protein